jgi:outer membrane protein OmpA-like peptidoglycan-associated protein
MPNNRIVNLADLNRVGLNNADRKVIIDLKTRSGDLGDDAFYERAIPLLSKEGKEKLRKERANRNRVVVAAPSPIKATLSITPTPAMLSEPGMEVVVRFYSSFAQAEVEYPVPFSMGATNVIELFYVRLDHVIHYRIQTRSREVIYERLLTPVNLNNATTPTTRWVATPPLGNNEAVRANKYALEANLVLDTTRPLDPAIVPVDSTAVFARNGRFIVIGQPEFGFNGYTLGVALVTQPLLPTIDSILTTNGGTVSVQQRFLLTDPRFAALVSALPTVSADLDYAGIFKTRQEAGSLDEVVGWIWVLSGPDCVVGFRPDPEPSQPASEVLLYLSGAIAGMPNTGLPQDVSESALLARPDLFSDDPGSTCRPFSNPGRVLGEKRFRTVLRVTQPQVALAGLSPIRFEDQDKRTVEYPRFGVVAANPIEYEVNPELFQAQSVALGHVIEHVIRYRSNGYSLGNVAHSLTLAPREKRRIMKVDFTRTERARRTEGTGSEDEVVDNLDSRRDYDNAVAGELSEWSRGSSEASAVGAAAGAGGIIPGVPVVIGGGIAGGHAQSNATQSSHRETAARESQRLRDAIRRYGQSLRRLESTVVTEVSQSETVMGVSEVVQNINYTRALSIVYYEILRHLRVDTEIGAVTECLFVPMPIREFNDLRISRYRAVLARFARTKSERSVFRYLDDIQANFVGSTVPPGQRRDQPLNRASGSLSIEMAINIPAGGAPNPITPTGDSEDRLVQLAGQFESAWQPFANLLPFPVPVVAQMMARTSGNSSETERVFRTQIAPAMARAVVDRLELRTGSDPLEVDFTAASAYKHGRTMKVDFDVAVDGNVTRRDLETMTLSLGSDVILPPGSWLNLKQANVAFATEHYDGRATQSSGNRDVVDVVTGHPDPAGAMIKLPPTQDDLIDMQGTLRRGYADLRKSLDANTFRYHKAIWMSMDPDELYAILDGYAISETDGRSIASVIERRPIGILGNSLVFSTRTDWPLDPMYRSFDDLKAHYVSGLPPADPIRISLSTSGLYARAHMDECVAAEEHNGSFDWVFDNTEPDLESFPSGMFDSRRSEPQGLSPTQLPDTIINLQNAPSAPQPSGLGSAFTALGNDAFRDITGLAGTQANLTAAMSNAANLATSFGQAAIAAQAAQLKADSTAGKDLRSFGSAVKAAVDRGQMSPDQGTAAVEEMAARRAAGGQPPKDDDLHAKVLTGDAEATHSSVDKDGTVKNTTKKPTPKRDPDPVNDISVVPIPDRHQVLFMNFATDGDALLPDHVRYLERLAGEIGLSIDDVVSIEGHASTAGDPAHNEELGRKRAFSLFDRLHKLVTPLGADPDYSPAFLSTAGEVGSYRTMFSHIPAVAKARGAGHPNDPVEKAVLFTFKERVNTNPPTRSYDCSGDTVTVINNYLYVGPRVFCSLPNGPIVEIDRVTTNILSPDFSGANILTGNNSIEVNVGPVAVAPTIAPTVNLNLNLSNFFSLSFGRDPETGYFEEPTQTEPLEKQLREEFTIRLNEPEIVNPKSMMSILGDLAQLALDIATHEVPLPSDAKPLVREIIDEAKRIIGRSEPKPGPVILSFILQKLGITAIESALEMIRFGVIKMPGSISVDDTEMKGMFSGVGLMVGATGPSSGAQILPGVAYRTGRPVRLLDWTKGNLQTFSYIDNGLIDSTLAAALAAGHINKALVDVSRVIMPDFIQMLGESATSSLLGTLSEALGAIHQYAPTASMVFKAFHGDDSDQFDSSSVNSAGSVRIVTITPGRMSFSKQG